MERQLDSSYSVHSSGCPVLGKCLALLLPIKMSRSLALHQQIFHHFGSFSDSAGLPAQIVKQKKKKKKAHVAKLCFL